MAVGFSSLTANFCLGSRRLRSSNDFPVFSFPQTPAKLRQAYSFRSISLFHSTPILERKRITHWNNGKGSHKAKRFNYYAKRMNKMESKRTLLRDISDYADYLFQSWRVEDEFKGFLPNDDTAWFRRKYWSKGAKLNGFSSNESQWGRYKNKRNTGFNFCAMDDDVETIFQSAYRREYEYWSFDSSENFTWRNPSGQTDRSSSWDWRYETEEEVDNSPKSELALERLALGLNASGPLKIEDVKIAYRACALRWHPDRHHGSSKETAEEKFKLCSAAYQSLCEKLAIQ